MLLIPASVIFHYMHPDVNSTMKLALAQINTIVGDLEGNTHKIIATIQKAKARHADLVVFPELAITGYPPKDLIEKKQFVKDNLKKLNEIIRVCTGIGVVVGFIDTKNGKNFNAAAFISNKKLLGVQYKTLLPTYDVFDETRYFKPAQHHQLFTFKKQKIGLQICEDLWDNNYSADVTKDLVTLGAQIIINISSSPFYVGKHLVRQKLIAAKSRVHHVPFFYVNQVGGNDELIFDGRSYVYNTHGKLCCALKAFSEDFVVVDTGTFHPIESPVFDEWQDLHDALVLGVKDYAQKNRFRKALIGISGGIDSAVTACLAVRALGKNNVLTVFMPSPYSSQESYQDAKELARRLGVKFLVITIDSLFEHYTALLKPQFKQLPEDTTEENLQARIRSTLLMALSNKFNRLLLTTGNKSEIAVGYCTLYGDMSGGLAVISDVPKTKVYKLAEYINNRRKYIPKRIFEKAPSAELKPHQTDQDTLPSYEILDAILELYIEKNVAYDEMIRKGFDAATVNKVIAQVNKSEYKRFQAAPGIRVTSKAFGSGRRFPITNKYGK